MHKLFSERIEIFSTVEFNKVSILTGIIKISLKVGYIIKFYCVVLHCTEKTLILDFYGVCTFKNV